MDSFHVRTGYFKLSDLVKKFELDAVGDECLVEWRDHRLAHTRLEFPHHVRFVGSDQSNHDPDRSAGCIRWTFWISLKVLKCRVVERTHDAGRSDDPRICTMRDQPFPEFEMIEGLKRPIRQDDISPYPADEC